MLKNVITVSINLIIFAAASVSNSNASIHSVLPTIDGNIRHDLAYYESKQDRCLLAFAKLEFDVAYAICTPMANQGF